MKIVGQNVRSGSEDSQGKTWLFLFLKKNMNEIENFIQKLDEYVRRNEMCVYPQGEDFDCMDCTICRQVFYDKIRDELINGYTYLN